MSVGRREDPEDPCSPAVSAAALARAVAILRGEAALLDDLIELRKRALERLRLVSNLELQERLLLHQLARALRILNARNLDDDAIVALLLDDRLRHAEAFDARADRLQRAIDRFRLLSRRNRLLRVVDLEREIRAALEIEALACSGTCARVVVVQNAVRHHARDASRRAGRATRPTAGRGRRWSSTRYFRGIRLREEGGWVALRQNL